MNPLFEAYLQTARTGAPWWRTLLAGLALVLIFILGSMAFELAGTAIVAATSENLNLTETYFEFQRLVFEAEVSWRGAFVSATVLLIIAMFWPASWIAQLILGSGLGRLLTFLGRVRWTLFWRAMALTFLVFLIAQGISTFLALDQMSLTDQLLNWALALPLLVAVIFLQASAEELVFRGWLVQQLGRLWQNPWFTFGLPALAFALLHAGNNEPANLGPIAYLFYFALSLPAAYAVYRTGGLEVACALHIINNVFAVQVMVLGTDKITNLGGFPLLFHHGDPIPTSLAFAIFVGVALVMEMAVVLALVARWSPLRISQEVLLGQK